jgi:lipopolysaccharide/colanic/teichoic acid biosynthesis glycosyltransferase
MSHSEFPYRARDVVVACVVGTLTLPLTAVTAAMVRLRMGRPVLFRQVRPGKDGRPFTMVKFRTMLHADPTAEIVTDEQRLTPLGRLLRASSLDELPTLWNVLSGDMSLVGPRPLLMAYLDRYTPEQARRHEVRPGITGWAQVNGRNAVSWEEKFAMDVWYVDHRSLLLDTRITALTLLKVLRRDGISADSHATMPEFLGTPQPTPPKAEPVR